MNPEPQDGRRRINHWAMAAPIIYSSPSPYSDSRLLIIRQKEGIGCTIFNRYAATFKQGRKFQFFLYQDQY